MRTAAASTDAAATGAESRSPGKLYALAVVGLAIFLLGIIFAPQTPRTHIARAVLAYRAAADTPAASARLSGEKIEELTALLESEGTLRAVLARLAADARTGFGKASPTADDLRVRLAIEAAPSDKPDEAWIAVHYLGKSPEQSLAVVEALCQEFVTSQSAAGGAAHRRLAAARAELAEAQTQSQAAFEKLEAYLAAHFAKLEHGPELISAALSGLQPKAPARAAKPAAPASSPPAAARPAGPATVVNRMPPPAAHAAAAPPPVSAPFPKTATPSAPPLPTAPLVAAAPPAPTVAAPAPPPARDIVPPAVAVDAPAPTPSAESPVGPRLNPAYTALQQRIAEVKQQQETLAATHTWAHPIVRALVDEELELKKQLRATPEILSAEEPAPPATPETPAQPAAESPAEPAVPPPPSPGPSLGPAAREPGEHRRWAVPRTSAPPPVTATAARSADPIEQLLVELMGAADREVYATLQADYAQSQQRLHTASEAERIAADLLAARPASAASLREAPRVTGRVGGGVCTAQLLLWAALAGVAGCLVSFWAGEIEPSPTIDRTDDVASRLGLPVVATLPTGGGTPAPIAPAEPPAWVGVAVRCAELTLVGILLLLAVGIVRSSELAGQLASDPLTTLIDCCAWWRR